MAGKTRRRQTQRQTPRQTLLSVASAAAASSATSGGEGARARFASICISGNLRRNRIIDPGAGTGPPDHAGMMVMGWGFASAASGVFWVRERSERGFLGVAGENFEVI